MSVYDQPLLRSLGESYVTVEFGDEVNLELSFRVLKLATALRERRLDGVIEVQPTLRTLAVIVDPTVLGHDRLVAEIHAALEAADETARIPSRLVTLPVWYDDPWSRAIARRYEVEDNLEFVGRVNGLSPQEVIDRHTGTLHWVPAITFQPGGGVQFPLDPAQALDAPKYSRPRDFTPPRAVSLGGGATALYSLPSPGGYQLIGRLAVEIFDRHAATAGSSEDGVLLRAGDRIRFVRVGPLEYDEIERRAAYGEYTYEIEEGEFDATEYSATNA